MYNNYPTPYQFQPYQAGQLPAQPQQQIMPQQSYAPQIRKKADIVQGEAMANVYPVNEGEEVVLFDMDSPYVYKKKRGFDGRLETEKDVLTRYEEDHSHDSDLYVRRDEIGGMMNDIISEAVENAVQRAMERFNEPKKRTKAED